MTHSVCVLPLCDPTLSVCVFIQKEQKTPNFWCYELCICLLVRSWLCIRTTCTHGCRFVCACTCLCNIHSGAAVMDGVLCCSSRAISQPESRGWPPAYDAGGWRPGQTLATAGMHACMCVYIVLLLMHVSTQPCVHLKRSFFLFSPLACCS